MGRLEFMHGSVDTFRVGAGLLMEPNAALMLPDGCVVVADHHLGLLKFSPYTQLLYSAASPDWKWPQGLAYDPKKSESPLSNMVLS